MRRSALLGPWDVLCLHEGAHGFVEHVRVKHTKARGPGCVAPLLRLLLLYLLLLL